MACTNIKNVKSFICSGCDDVEAPCITTLATFDADDASKVCAPRSCLYGGNNVHWSPIADGTCFMSYNKITRSYFNEFEQIPDPNADQMCDRCGELIDRSADNFGVCDGCGENLCHRCVGGDWSDGYCSKCS